MRFFVNHRDAARTLARGLDRYAASDAVVLAVDDASAAIASAVGAGLGLPVATDLGATADLHGRIAIVVGAGLGAGLGQGMAEAVRVVRARGAWRVIVAVPVGAAAEVEALEDVAHDVVCPLQPRQLGNADDWYEQAA
jgi:predicted phosphoribosyltransferase